MANFLDNLFKVGRGIGAFGQSASNALLGAGGPVFGQDIYGDTLSDKDRGALRNQARLSAAWNVLAGADQLTPYPRSIAGELGKIGQGMRQAYHGAAPAVIGMREKADRQAALDRYFGQGPLETVGEGLKTREAEFEAGQPPALEEIIDASAYQPPGELSEREEGRGLINMLGATRAYPEGEPGVGDVPGTGEFAPPPSPPEKPRGRIDLGWSGDPGVHGPRQLGIVDASVREGAEERFRRQQEAYVREALPRLEAQRRRDAVTAFPKLGLAMAKREFAPETTAPSTTWTRVRPPGAPESGELDRYLRASDPLIDQLMKVPGTAIIPLGQSGPSDQYIWAYDPETLKAGRFTNEEIRDQGLVPVPTGQEITVDADGNVTIRSGDLLRGSGKTENEIRANLHNSTRSLSRALRLRNQYQPIFQQMSGKLTGAYLSFIEKAGVGLSDEDKQYLADYTRFRRQGFESLNLYIKQITGAQMSEAEAERLTKAMPNPGSGVFSGDSPSAFETKLDDVINQLRIIRARSVWMLEKGMIFPTGGAKFEISVEEMDGIMNGRFSQIAEQLKTDFPDLGENERMRQAGELFAEEFGLVPGM